MSGCAHAPSPDPRKAGCCVKCGHRIPAGAWRQRNPDLERYLVSLAARAAGFPDDGGMWSAANARAHPGPVRVRPMRPEAQEEALDGINYLAWDIEPIYPLVIEGEPEAVERYASSMAAMAGFVTAWRNTLR